MYLAARENESVVVVVVVVETHSLGILVSQFARSYTLNLSTIRTRIN